MSNAVMSVCANPFGAAAAERRAVPAGTTLRDLAPTEYRGLLICRLNGGPGYVLRADWDYPVQAGDVVEFFDMPQGGGLLRTLLQIVVIAASIYAGGIPGLLIGVLGNLAINALLPPTSKSISQGDAQTASPTYSTSLSGNQARPDSPIPRNCGRVRIVPSFAGQPYVEYDSLGDQYYYAILVVGYGNYDIERAMIDDTSINHFRDIIVSNYLPPGVQPAQAKANVVTAPEVSGLEMLSGKFIGGFAASGPTLKAVKIGIDMIMPRGLAHQNDDGSMGNLRVSWRVDWREIDDFGAALTAWAILATESRTDNKITVRRYTSTYTLPVAKRVEIRVVRLDTKSTSSRDSHDLQWAGLRAYLSDVATLNPGTAHYEIVMRASEQLSSLSQRSIALIVRSKTRTWSSGGGWGPEVYTRTPSWWMLDLASNSSWGLGLPDERIDFPSFKALADISDARQDRFDYTFDTTTDGWEALQLIARSARARVFRRNGVLTVARDELQTLPITAFTPRNTQPGSMSVAHQLPTKEMNDGFIVEYFNNRTWTWVAINCPCPGVTTMSRPVRMRLPGITGAKHAEREGRYEAARMLYRRRTVSCTTEMEGVLPAFMSPVRWMPELYGYGQSGDVVDWNPTALTISLSEPLVFTDSNYLTLMRDDGTLTDPVSVLPGPTAYDAVLPSAPDFPLALNNPDRDRPRFLFGRQASSDELVKIISISDGGKTDEGAQLYDISAIVDDARVHAVDNSLLPGPGEVQDPVDNAADTGGSGDLVIINLSNHTIDTPDTPSSIAEASFTVLGDGRARGDGRDIDGNLGIDSMYFADQWMQFSPQDHSVTTLYDVRATLTAGALTSGTVDTWMDAGDDHTWLVQASVSGSEQSATLYVEVRDSASRVVQASATVNLHAALPSPGDGGDSSDSDSDSDSDSGDSDSSDSGDSGDGT